MAATVLQGTDLLVGGIVGAKGANRLLRGFALALESDVVSLLGEVTLHSLRQSPLCGAQQILVTPAPGNLQQSGCLLEECGFILWGMGMVEEPPTFVGIGIVRGRRTPAMSSW